MKYPLGIVVDFLNQKGYEIVRLPDDQRIEFDLLTADSEGSSVPKGERIVQIAYANEDMSCQVGEPADTNRNEMRLIRIGWTDDDDAIVIRTCKTPSGVTFEIQRHLIDIFNWVHDMHRALAKQRACEDILRLSERILQRFVSVSDANFSLVARTPDIEPPDDQSRFLIENGHYSDEALIISHGPQHAVVWESPLRVITLEGSAMCPLYTSEHIFYINEQYAAHMVMVSETPITIGQEFLFELMVDPVEVALNRQWRESNPFNQRYTAFVTGLLEGDRSNRSVVQKLARSVGVPAEGIYKVYVVGDTWDRGRSGSLATYSLLHTVGIMALIKDDQIVIVANVDKDAGAERLSKLEQRVFDIVKSTGAQIGVSRKKFDLLDLPAAYAEASIALDYGMVHHRDYLTVSSKGEDDPNAYIYRFKRYLPYFMTDPRAKKNVQTRISNICSEVIARIERDDAQNDTQDASVLRTYLRESGNIAIASAKVGLHRNSFTYRLRHIEKVYDLNLSDPDERAFLFTLFLLPRE